MRSGDTEQVPFPEKAQTTPSQTNDKASNCAPNSVPNILHKLHCLPNMSGYQFQHTQYELKSETVLKQEAHFVESGLDANESVLYNLQLVFLIDISGSMQESDVDPDGVGTDGLLGRGRWTRYDNMVKIMKSMTNDLLKFDKDKRLPCYFFNNQVKRVELQDPNMVIAQIRTMKPEGTTALHLAIQEACKNELNDVDNFLFIVFTDGVPDDPAAAASVIQNEIHRRDPKGDCLNILFVRFGDDPGAVKFLQDQDNHEVYGASVDTKSDNACFLLGPKLLVLNAIYEKIENDPAWASRLAKCK
jgi:hypothetical protein